MLDFVPNHMAPDPPWVEDHPDYFVPGTEDLLAREPQNYIREGNEVLERGLYLDLQPWTYHVFNLEIIQ